MVKFKNLTIAPIPVDTIRRVDIVQLGGLTMGQWYAKQTDKPKYLINASLWDNQGAIGSIYEDGLMVRNEGGGFGFGVIGKEDEVKWAFGEPWDNVWRNYITGTPAMIVDGKQTDAHMPITRDEVVATRRSAFCASGNVLYMVTSSNLTLQAFKDQLSAFGMYHALNLDGGGSSRMLIDGMAVNDPTDDRRNPNAIAIWVKEDDKTEVIEEETKPMASYDVCLDPGHGASTAGKASPDGTYREYEFNRDMCKRITAHLERSGLKVCQTVTDDSDPSLAHRCKFANDSKAKIVVSVHSNAAGNGWSSANYFLECIIAKGGNAEKLGWAIEEEFLKQFPDVKSNGVQVQNLAMVRDTDAPAVLIEHGFHTNKNWVENVLKTDEGRAKLAEADARGICKHLGVTYVEEVKDDEDKETNDDVNMDTPATWAKEAWEKANKKIGTDGKPIMDGTRPTDNITRQEMAVVLNRLGLLD